MANKIKLKKSVVANRAPTVNDLDYGELAINYNDGKLYFKKSDGVNSANDSIEAFFFTQLISISKSLTLTTDWQDTGISGTDLATGTYVIQLFANDAPGGGTNNNEYYSGTMSWYSGATNSSTEMPTDEILLHRAGGSGEGELYLRTYRTPGGVLKLQVFANVANASASNYMFKFRRMI